MCHNCTSLPWGVFAFIILESEFKEIKQGQVCNIPPLPEVQCSRSEH